MNILDRLIVELKEAKGPVLVSVLAKRLNVSSSAIQGMLDVLISKGILSLSVADSTATARQSGSLACSGLACSASCVGLDECPFIVKIPDSYTLVAPVDDIAIVKDF